MAINGDMSDIELNKCVMVERCSRTDFLKIGSEILTRGAVIRFSAPGRSMFPSIRDGEIIEVMPVDIANVRIGDIILYRSQMGSAVVHRVIGKKKLNSQEMIVTKGDSLQGPDSPIKSQQIFGKVIAIERDGKRICLNSIAGRLYGLMRVGRFLLIYRIRVLLGKIKNRLLSKIT